MTNKVRVDGILQLQLLVFITSPSITIAIPQPWEMKISSDTTLKNPAEDASSIRPVLDLTTLRDDPKTLDESNATKLLAFKSNLEYALHPTVRTSPWRDRAVNIAFNFELPSPFAQHSDP